MAKRKVKVRMPRYYISKYNLEKIRSALQSAAYHPSHPNMFQAEAAEGLNFIDGYISGYENVAGEYEELANEKKEI